MLSNELLGFIRRQDVNVSADSAADDLYTWNVWLWRSAFDPASRLAKVRAAARCVHAAGAGAGAGAGSLAACNQCAGRMQAAHDKLAGNLARAPHPCAPCTQPPQDLHEVSSKWAVSGVQLRFTFMRGLHPFYPPRLEVVRPHLDAPLPGALASHPLLRLEHWDPWLNMSQLIDVLRQFLEVTRGARRCTCWDCRMRMLGCRGLCVSHAAGEHGGKAASILRACAGETISRACCWRCSAFAALLLLSAGARLRQRVAPAQQRCRLPGQRVQPSASA